MMSIAGLEPWVAAWGYPAICLMVLLGNIGAPVPEETILLLSGYLAWRGVLSLSTVVLVGTLSVVLGDNMSYWLGREAGRPLLLRYGRYLFVTPHQIRRAELFFARRGPWAVFWARFLAGVRFLAAPLAGIACMPFARFFTANALGAVAYVPLVTFLGYRAGPVVSPTIDLVWRVQQLVLVGMLLLLVTWLGWRVWVRPKG
jgi:membrane protein DedA with SNARE-associated domain